jgi:alpha-N-arabinofuranosidase
MTEKGGASWRQTIFYPFYDASHFGRGTVLRCPVTVAQYDSREYCDVPYLEAVGVYNKEKKEINIFAVNRNLKEAIDLEAHIAGFGTARLIEHRVLSGDDLHACNSAAQEKVKPVIKNAGTLESAADSARLEISLPPASWNVIRLGL